LQVIFCKRATNYRALLRKMTYEYKASYVSLPPCIRIYGSFMLTCSCVTHDLFVCMAHVDMLHTRANMPHLCMWYIGAFMRDTRLIRIYGSFMSTCYTREQCVWLNHRSLLQKRPIKETIFCKRDLWHMTYSYLWLIHVDVLQTRAHMPYGYMWLTVMARSCWRKTKSCVLQFVICDYSKHA